MYFSSIYFLIEVPAPKAGEIPTQLQQATGKEREQYLAELEGRDIYNSEVDGSYYGTLERPVVFRTRLDSRIIGCEGFPAGGHEILWFEARVGETVRCPECGQALKLEPAPPKVVYEQSYMH